jgi:small-conductance mechanosensitive channel
MILAAPISGSLTNVSIDGWDIAFAVVTLVIAWILGRITQRTVLRLAGRVEGISPDLRVLAARLSKYFVLLIGIGIALGFLGAPVQPLLAAVVIVGIVAALALRGIADNFAAGVIIQTRRPIHVGDDIEALGHIGVVRELNSRAVVIENLQGAMVHLPNAKLLDNPIVNHSTRPSRCSEVEVELSSDEEPLELSHAVRASTSGVAGVLAEPAPTVAVTGVEPGKLVAVVRFWHEPASTAGVTGAVIGALAHDFRARGTPATVTWTSTLAPPLSAAPPAPAPPRP